MRKSKPIIAYHTPSLGAIPFQGIVCSSSDGHTKRRRVVPISQSTRITCFDIPEPNVSGDIVRRTYHTPRPSIPDAHTASTQRDHRDPSTVTENIQRHIFKLVHDGPLDESWDNVHGAAVL